jgi:hypothetical protein
MRLGLGRRRRRANRRKEQRANGLVDDEVRWQSKLVRDLVRTAVVVDVFDPQPIRRAQKLARENVGLNLLPFARRIAFDAAGAAVDGIAAEAVRSHRDLILRIAMEAVMADLMRDDDQLVGRVLMLGDVDEPRRAIEKAKHARTDDAARFVLA